MSLNQGLKPYSSDVIILMEFIPIPIKWGNWYTSILGLAVSDNSCT